MPSVLLVEVSGCRVGLEPDRNCTPVWHGKLAHGESPWPICWKPAGTPGWPPKPEAQRAATAGLPAELRTSHGIGVVLERAADAAEQIADGRRTEALRVVAADHQVVDRLPGQAELAVGGVAERAVVRVATGHVERQFLRERNVLQHRHVDFEVVLVDAVAAAGRTGRQVGAEAGLGERIRHVDARFVAVLIACRDAEVARRQREHRTGEVRAVVDRAGVAGGVVEREQIGLQVRVGQRVRPPWRSGSGTGSRECTNRACCRSGSALPGAVPQVTRPVVGSRNDGPRAPVSAIRLKSPWLVVATSLLLT